MSDRSKGWRGRKTSALLFGAAKGRGHGRAVLAALLAAVLGILGGFILFDKIVMPRVVREGSEVRIPVVSGKAVKQAEAVLRAAGLEPMTAPGQHHAQVARGLVLDVSPSSGMSVKKGRQVFLIPSLGPVNRRVPELVGQSMRMVRMQLADASLHVGRVDYAATDLVAPDQVLAVTPEPGAPAPENGEVSLLVSQARTPSPYWMPYLDGRRGREAAGWLTAAGLNVPEAADAGQYDIVTGQNPAPGSAIWPGMKAGLHFGAGRPRLPEHSRSDPLGRSLSGRGRRW